MYGEPMEEGSKSLDFTVVGSATCTPTTKEYFAYFYMK